MSGRRPSDQAERDRIGRALDDTLFVEAGAGTGKTTQLVDRVVALVLEDRVPLAAIAAITFTEAAAAELRDRIRRRLEEVCESGDGPAATRAAAALEDIDVAALSTLHAFAFRILSEHPVEAGLPPSVDVIDEVRSQLAFEERWEAFVDDLMSDPQFEPMVIRAAALGVRIESRVPGQPSLKDVARILGQNWDRLDTLLAAEPDGAPPPVDRAAILAAVDALAAVDRHCSEPDDCGLQHHLAARRDALEALRSAEDDIVLGLVADAELRWRCRFGNQAHCAEPKAIREALVAIDEAIAAERSRLVDDTMRRFGAALARFTDGHARSRIDDGSLEFHDLLVLARRLVRESPTARAALHDRYRRLLLDEFQDTDPIQIELATLVASTGADGQVDGWLDVEVEAGRLFFVGDAKQSIYRFRRADIRVFMAARHRFGADEPVALTENFRTVPPVLDWVNTLFARVMTEDPGRQPGYVPLRPFRVADSGADHRPVLMGRAHPGAKAAEIRRHEALDVARALRDIQERPETWPVDDGEGGWRPARMDDVAVLIPARTSLRFLEQALQEAGVRYRVDTGALVYDTQEVVELLAVLRVLDDPTDAVSLVAALRSPLFGCGDDDLARFKLGGGSWDLNATVPDELAEGIVGRSMDWLRVLHQRRWWSTPSELLLAIVEQRRAFEQAFALDRPRDVWRRLRFLVDQARLFEESEGGDLRDFLAWADLQRHEAARVHEPVLPEPDDRSARVMTIHGAKGLEFPITVVSGLSTRFPGRRPRGPAIVWDDDGQVATSLSSSARTENFDVVADFEAELEQGERLRLLYVALTRARDHLLVTTHHKPPDNGKVASFAQMVATEMAEHGELHRELDEVIGPAEDGVGAAVTPAPPGHMPTAAVDPVDLPRDEAQRAAWLTARAAALADAGRPATVSPTAVASGSLDEDADRRDPVGIDEDLTPDEAVFRRGRAGTAVGRAVHSVLQHGDLVDGSDLADLARSAASAEAVPDEEATIASRVQSARRSNAVRRALAADRHWRELPVCASVGDRTVEGYIDLLFEDGDGLVVVDYKTDRVDGPADVDRKVDRYRLQAATYAVALEQTTSRPVQECRFVFATDGEAVERVVEDLDGAKAEVRVLLGVEPGTGAHRPPPG